MSGLLDTYQLYSPEDDDQREVEVFDAIDKSHVDYIDREWAPLLKSQRQLAAIRFKQLGKSSDDEWQQLLGEYGAPDSHWDWNDFAKPSIARSTHKSFSVLSGGDVEAVMVVDLTQRCELSEQADEHLVYIENLAVAPWNRDEIQSPRRFGGLGKVMLALAVELSRNEGWDGRVGLHSLSQSEDFYQKCSLVRVKKDSSHEDLWYYEFTPSLANKFLS